MISRLTQAHADFATLPDIRAERLDTPHGAFGKCKWAASRFHAHLAGSPHTVLNLGGYLGRVAHAIQPWRSLGHPESWIHYVVVDAQGNVIDWTARQFDVSAPWPWVYPQADLARYWAQAHDVTPHMPRLTPGGRRSTREPVDLPRIWREVKVHKDTPAQSVQTVQAMTALLLRYFPGIAEQLADTTLEFVQSDIANAWYLPQTRTIRLTAAPQSPEALFHEVGHMLDANLYRGTGTCMLGTDQWASCEKSTQFGGFINGILPLVDLDALVQAKVEAFLTDLPPDIAGPLLAGEGVPQTTAIRAILARARLPVTPARLNPGKFRTPFGGFRTADYAAATGLPPEPVRLIAKLQRLRSQGVPMSLFAADITDEQRQAALDTLRVKYLRREMVGYFKGRHEVFARLFDQAIRVRASRAGILVGPEHREGDLPAAKFKQVQAEFWQLAEGLGWT